MVKLALCSKDANRFVDPNRRLSDEALTKAICQNLNPMAAMDPQDMRDPQDGADAGKAENQHDVPDHLARIVALWALYRDLRQAAGENQVQNIRDKIERVMAFGLNGVEEFREILQIKNCDYVHRLRDLCKVDQSLQHLSSNSHGFTMRRYNHDLNSIEYLGYAGFLHLYRQDQSCHHRIFLENSQVCKPARFTSDICNEYIAIDQISLERSESSDFQTNFDVYIYHACEHWLQIQGDEIKFCTLKVRITPPARGKHDQPCYQYQDVEGLFNL